MDITQLFILTTHSLHWFREQGFSEIQISELPIKKRDLYNFQRNSKILALDV
ncbi:N-acetylglutamate synthase [Vibrio ishigakensis]|uniref:N-acetylglutamate synthase n=1 Tax=Vibrio ishigakensis TaxID=1481914 RepID=A0A0B8QU21_9VIBR|nr:N-acetylglutamate synthase [Vibrio ishigakensis]GAM69885.1 N-acetylglutamate synthase [Vibrio sp. JCM 19236]GAM78428.1 N-acetylglutamate synthase [Vibrio ishigakensis]